jgi:invasion protein IalB
MAAPVAAQAQTPKAHTSKSSPAKSSKAKSNAKSHAKPAAKPAVPHVGGAEPTLVGQYANWGAYVATPHGKKVCFALAKPSSSKTNPPNRPRDPAYAFISTRPAEKVMNEVSVMIGYTIKPGDDSSLSIGNAHYAMYAQGDGLWIKNAAEEDRLVDALRKGADATVKATSSKGTDTTDVFSLKGLSQALDKVAQECRK